MISILHSALDLISIMSYDFHELNRTSINAPLSRENNQNPYTETVAENIDRILAQGCPRDKIIMGIPTYGRTYTLRDSNVNGVDAAVDGLGEPGPFTVSAGSLGFNEVKYLTSSLQMILQFHFSHLTFNHFRSIQICLVLSRGEWTIKHLRKNASKIAFRGKQWISYDDPETVYQKVCEFMDANRELPLKHATKVINQSLFVCLLFTYPLFYSPPPDRQCLLSREAWAA